MENWDNKHIGSVFIIDPLLDELVDATYVFEGTTDTNMLNFRILSNDGGKHIGRVFLKKEEEGSVWSAYRIC